MDVSVTAVRIVMALVVLFSVSFAPSVEAQDADSTQNEDIYVVKKGEVFDWFDVMKKGTHWSGFGYDELLARLNGSPKLKPGTSIRMAPLDEMLRAAGVFQRWPEARLLLEARNIALTIDRENTEGEKKAEEGFRFRFSNMEKLREDISRIVPQLQAFRESLPRSASNQVRSVIDNLNRLKTVPQHWHRKDQMALLRRVGTSFLELHKLLELTERRKSS